MSGEILVQVDGVSRRYGDIEAVKHVSFSLRQGEVLGFLGPNGAGKTTCMQMLTGNLAPSEGCIAIAGHDLLDDPKPAKRAIGYLPEQPPVYRDLTVDEYLRYCAALRVIPRARRAAACEAAKQKCTLTDVGRRLIGNLSKGYQQRVGLAQAILHLPPVIVLDEPTAGLDPIQIREMRGLIRALGRDHGVILSTHILPEVQASCDRVQIIHNGELVLSDDIAGLSRRMQSSVLLLGLRRPPALAALQAIAGVTAIEAADDGRLRVFYEAGNDPSEALTRQAHVHDWGLYELSPQHATLEDLFVKLTAADAATAAPP
ncbi:MAG: ATP-binding cassette domain-containing protein [Gammaproteobacteria bacterium]|nr:ATP-binding cassette domain-containing protein [Gammaproteobacteria bacterium]